MDIISRWAANMSVSQKSSIKSLDITSAYRRRTGQWRILFLSKNGFLNPVSSWNVAFPIFNPLSSIADRRFCIISIKKRKEKKKTVSLTELQFSQKIVKQSKNQTLASPTALETWASLASCSRFLESISTASFFSSLLSGSCSSPFSQNDFASFNKFNEDDALAAR